MKSHINTIEIVTKLKLSHDRVISILSEFSLLPRCTPIDIGTSICYNLDRDTWRHFLAIYNSEGILIPFIPRQLNEAKQEAELQEFITEHYQFLSHEKNTRIETEVSISLSGQRNDTIGQEFVGRIDVLTSRHIIEIKPFKNWMHGLGQLLVYQAFYRDRIPSLVLCGSITAKKALFVTDLCWRVGIDVCFFGHLNNYRTPIKVSASEFRFGRESIMFCFRNYLKRIGIDCSASLGMEV